MQQEKKDNDPKLVTKLLGVESPCKRECASSWNFSIFLQFSPIAFFAAVKNTTTTTLSPARSTVPMSTFIILPKDTFFSSSSSLDKNSVSHRNTKKISNFGCDGQNHARSRDFPFSFIIPPLEMALDVNVVQLNV